MKQEIYESEIKVMSLSISENIKRISINSRRQLTIPQAFYSLLGFGREADCIVKDDMLIIKPIKSFDEDTFSEQILAELIAKGFKGQKLLEEFKKLRSQVKPAVKNLLKEAHLAAEGKTKYYTKNEVFGKNR